MKDDFVIIVDAETTGFPDFRAPSDAEHQPHIVQFCALKVNKLTGEIVETIESVIKPDGWTIPEEAAGVHGVTTEIAMVVGKPEAEIISQFAEMRGDLTAVCHGSAFIGKVLRTAAKRFLSEQVAEIWKVDGLECTAALSKNIVCVPAAKSGFKNPTLPQAYEHFFKRELVDPHSAVSGAYAVKEVYFNLVF